MRHSSRRVGSRALTLILVVIGAQLGAGEIAAADDSAPPSGEPSVTQQLAAEQATPAPATDPAAASASAAPAQPAPATTPASSSVTISRAKASATRIVSIVDFAYDPTALSVKVGDTVQWINNGTADEGHNVIGDGLASPVLHTGESYTFTFSTAGTYDYVCTIHPKMKATVEVIDPNADEPTPKKSGGRKRGGNSSGGGSAGSGGSSGSSDSSASSSATGPGSESAAVGSAGAAGTSGSLPSTGSRSLSLALAGLALLSLGLALRSAEARRLQRRD